MPAEMSSVLEPIWWPQAAVTRLHWTESLLGRGGGLTALPQSPPHPSHSHEGSKARHESTKPEPCEHLGISHDEG